MTHFNHHFKESEGKKKESKERLLKMFSLSRFQIMAVPQREEGRFKLLQQKSRKKQQMIPASLRNDHSSCLRTAPHTTASNETGSKTTFFCKGTCTDTCREITWPWNVYDFQGKTES